MLVEPRMSRSHAASSVRCSVSVKKTGTEPDAIDPCLARSPTSAKGIERWHFMAAQSAVAATRFARSVRVSSVGCLAHGDRDSRTRGAHARQASVDLRRCGAHLRRVRRAHDALAQRWPRAASAPTTALRSCCRTRSSSSRCGARRASCTFRGARELASQARRAHVHPRGLGDEAAGRARRVARVRGTGSQPRPGANCSSWVTVPTTRTRSRPARPSRAADRRPRVADLLHLGHHGTAQGRGARATRSGQDPAGDGGADPA